jgi:hypothetical protein
MTYPETHQIQGPRSVLGLAVGVSWNGAGSAAHPWGRPQVLQPVRMPADGGLAADPAFAAAIVGLGQHSTPYRLAHGLLDYAAYLSHVDGDEAAGAVIGEARDIAGCLRCQPLLISFPQIRGSGARW